MYNHNNEDSFRRAEEVHWSFRDVPGDTRAKKVAHVCAERAAVHWRNGDHSEFYADRLADGKIAGFEFEGVDYTKIKHSGTADAFSRLIAESIR